MPNTFLENQFVVAVLCPDANFTHLLEEAQKNNFTVLEMIPFSKDVTDLSTQSRGKPIFFVYGEGKSVLATSKHEIASSLQIC
jgi:hypothetical protein